MTANQLTEAEVRAFAASCSNTGRWGDNDEFGTLNFITVAKRLQALSLARVGDVLSIGKNVPYGHGAHGPGALHLVTLGPTHSSQDAVLISPHGYDITHLDAVGHSFLDGAMYNGRRASEQMTPDGLNFGSMLAASAGIVTRGILLDVAEARGVRFLGQGYGISVADLEASEQAGGVLVESGDAIFVRSGLDVRESINGVSNAASREGVLPEVIPWLHAREVAVYSGDCIEQQPSGFDDLPTPLHQIGMAAMGLMLLDNVDTEVLAEACKRNGRNDFLLVAAPLRLPQATGSPVNPLAIF